MGDWLTLRGLSAIRSRLRIALPNGRRASWPEALRLFLIRYFRYLERRSRRRSGPLSSWLA